MTMIIHWNLFQGVFGEVNDHLEMGKKFLQEGNLAEALKHYNMAVCMFDNTSTIIHYYDSTLHSLIF